MRIALKSLEKSYSSCKKLILNEPEAKIDPRSQRFNPKFHTFAFPFEETKKRTIIVL